MRSVIIELEPCCESLNSTKKHITPISKFVEGTNIVRIGVKIRNGMQDGITLWYCPWCGKEINLKVKN